MRTALLFLALSLIVGAEPQLRTIAEQTDFQRTGRYAEVQQLCAEFARRWPKTVRVETFGQTPEGRPMLALVIARAPEGSPVLLLQGGIHAGEIDGKDAGFMALRELLENDDPALSQCRVVFVPVFNIDGHERFGPNHRPNQVGPQEMGWRVTSQNLNLNRDYVKADAPEMQAMLRLLRRWDPILYVDLHVTDGAQFQIDVANLVEPIFAGSPTLQPSGKKLQAELNASLRAQGKLAVDFYPSLRDGNNPASGFTHSAYMPRFSTGYWALHNRLALLVETHSWKPYPSRVETTRQIVRELVRLTARDGTDWMARARQAERENLAGTTVPLSFRTGDRSRLFDFPGYAYRRERSPLSGGMRVRYFPDQPQNWKVPLFYEVLPDLQVVAPGGGYLVPGWLRDKLDLHGIVHRPLAAGEREVEAFRADKVELGGRSVEGRQMARLHGRWARERQWLPETYRFVPIDQPRARLALALLEPQAPDSFAAWGFFNAHFERKEYMEDYVAEEVGEQMLASSPAVATEFRTRLASDPEFARSPEARLDFFYRRHPSWDQKYNLYPVFRSEQKF